MIKIDVMQINDWEKIKINHIQYLKTVLEKELSNLYIGGDVYIKRRKEKNKSSYKIYYKLNKDDQLKVSKIFGGEFIEKNNKASFTIKNIENIKKIAIGDINEIVDEFNRVKLSNDLLERLFNYQKFCNDKTWNRYKLLTLLNIRVCPYCNRQYITNYESNNAVTKTTADLDHYYSQSEYPYLALSLFNFVPSCQICNSRFKLDKDFYKEPHTYPYLEEFGNEAKFKIRSRNIDYLFGNSQDFEIDFEIKTSKNKEKIQNSINTFHLKEIYKVHTDYVQEIIKKAIMYNASKIEEMLIDFPELFSSKEEILRIIFGNYLYDDDLGKRPLAKLTKDVCEDLGIEIK